MAIWWILGQPEFARLKRLMCAKCFEHCLDTKTSGAAHCRSNGPSTRWNNRNTLFKLPATGFYYQSWAAEVGSASYMLPYITIISRRCCIWRTGLGPEACYGCCRGRLIANLGDLGGGNRGVSGLSRKVPSRGLMQAMSIEKTQQ